MSTLLCLAKASQQLSPALPSVHRRSALALAAGDEPVALTSGTLPVALALAAGDEPVALTSGTLPVALAVGRGRWRELAVTWQ